MTAQNPSPVRHKLSFAVTAADRTAAILGAADGLTLAVSLVFGRNAHVFHAALDAGIGELVGMAAALYLSSEKRELMPAFLCGLTTLIACVIPAIPYAVGSGAGAAALSALLAMAVAALVCWIRPEKGWAAIAETYGVLVASGLLCFVTSFWS